MKKKNLQDETAITTSVTKKEMPELSLFVFLLQVSITPVQRHSKLSHTLGDVLHFKARLDTWTGKSKSEAMWRERTASPPKELPIVFFLEPVKEVLKSFFQKKFFGTYNCCTTCCLCKQSSLVFAAECLARHLSGSA